MHEDMDKNLEALEERLGVTFNNRQLLLEALTHRSHINECRACVRHNELLEFLGDSALGLAVTKHLFDRFRGKETEGTLTSWRAALVNTERLAQVGESLKLHELMLMSHGQAKGMVRGSKEWRYMVGCAMEAVLGAIMYDQGFGMVRMVVDAFLHTHFSQIITSFVEIKSDFQELAQARFGVTPTYRVIREWGPDHARQFLVAVYVGKLEVAQGQGASKREAEKAAATTALQTINDWEGRLGKRGHDTVSLNASPRKRS